MVIKDVIEAIKMALGSMNNGYCTLSQIDYSKISMDGSIKKHLIKEKYLERPFAYEFYHQLRKLMDKREVSFGGPIIQAEVAKKYQKCFKTGKIPDFIIHVPNVPLKNPAVIEFKLATNLDGEHGIEHDLKKLVEFKKNEHLRYSHGIEVIIGSETSLKNATERIKQLDKSEGEEIIIIEFDTGLWQANDWKIRYSDIRNDA